MGIVGLPNVGKSTLFSALTKNPVAIENYPFCTIDPTVGVVSVPDHRLKQLSDISQSEETIPAVIEFVDIAGLVKGAAQGEGLGNQFLANIRETHAVVHVVRFFDNADITHVSGEIDPRSDMETINLELTLADLERVTGRREKIEREVKRGDKAAIIEDEMLLRLEQALTEGRPARTVSVEEDEIPFLRQLQLLTTKPMLYALNTQSGGHNLTELKDVRYQNALEYISEQGAEYVVVDADTEKQLNDVADEDRETFRHELGVIESGLDALIKKSYETLGLITYFTTGPKETRAWTIRAGESAPQAGAAIHSDFKDKFIRAEVVATRDLIEAGSYAKAREIGKVRTEGKEYIVSDGDVINFLHS